MKNLKKIPHALLIICFSSIIFAQSFTPIGVVNPNNYISKQKDIAVSSYGMVTTQHYIATKVGEDILKNGGMLTMPLLRLVLHLQLFFQELEISVVEGSWLSMTKIQTKIIRSTTEKRPLNFQAKICI